MMLKKTEEKKRAKSRGKSRGSLGIKPARNDFSDWEIGYNY